MKPTLLALAALTLYLGARLHGKSSKPPNLIIILADDMGYSDPACFGGEMATPAIDRLAHEGVRLTRFQNGGMCVVSRASLFTGQWWPRALKNFERSPLLSEELRKIGYRSALIGADWQVAS